MKRPIQIISIFLFVFITNAAISPIVISNRYLFWAIGGFVVLFLYRECELSAKQRRASKFAASTLAIFIAAVLGITALIFGYSQIKYLTYGEFNKSTNGHLQEVSVDPFLPCQHYFDDLVKYTGVISPENSEKLSSDRLKSNPRCFAAVLRLGAVAAERRDIPMMRKYVYKLMEIAPARRETLDLATNYAIMAKDKKLEEVVRKTFAKLGILLLDVNP